MKQVEIFRVVSNSIYGTYGVLLIEKTPVCVTLERYWYFNKRNVSCIYPGQFVCELIKSEKYGETYIVNDVNDRTGILFHCGNVMSDSTGCILVGQSFGNGVILHSRQAFKKFIDELDGDKEFMLTIKECY